MIVINHFAVYDIGVSQIDTKWLVRKALNQTIVRVIWVVFWVDIAKTNIVEFFANGHFRANKFNDYWLLGHRLLMLTRLQLARNQKIILNTLGLVT